MRVFAGRDSSGVRGIRLAKGDEVISLSVLRHVEATTRNARRISSCANARRRSNGDEEAEPRRREAEEAGRRGRDSAPEPHSPSWRRSEEILLTVTDAGFGKRTSAYEYRVTGRGGQGIANIALVARNGTAVVGDASRSRQGDDVMLVHRCRAG